MSNKSFCDKCGEEVKIIGTYDNGEVKTANCMSLRKDVPTFRRKSYDLCDKCVTKLEEWMNEKPTTGGVITYYTYAGVPIKHDARNVYEFTNCLGDNSIYCVGTMTGRMSGSEPNLSNLPKFTTP